MIVGLKLHVDITREGSAVLSAYRTGPLRRMMGIGNINLPSEMLNIKKLAFSQIPGNRGGSSNPKRGNYPQSCSPLPVRSLAKILDFMPLLIEMYHAQPRRLIRVYQSLTSRTPMEALCSIRRLEAPWPYSFSLYRVRKTINRMMKISAGKGDINMRIEMKAR